ncbi:efflux RND transporter periplasmic adaptor subunit [Trichothermofontia sp.]
MAIASLLVLPTTGCVWQSRGQAGAQQGPPRGQRDSGPIVVETAVATTGALGEALIFTGTTEPRQQVTLRSQADGQLLNLRVDVGDPVQQGQRLGQLDAVLLETAVREEEAELAARQVEVSQAKTLVADAQTQVEQARATLQQAQADADRLQSLADQGAISQQQAELAQTSRRTAEQALRSAQEQVRTRQQAIAAVERRVAAQQAIVQQAKQRLTHTVLVSPLTGVVLRRFVEAGDLIQPGQEVLQLGDLQTLKVRVQVSDRDLSQVQTGQAVQVQFDALPNQTFSGQVARIAPTADPAGRLLPVEINLPNPNGKLGSGLLARVQFTSLAPTLVVVPEAALAVGADTEKPTIFVVQETEAQLTVQPRPVQISQQVEGQVALTTGLQPGERFVIRSNRPLRPGQRVETSLLSES